MTYDVAALRHHFPSLDSGIAHFDGPGGTQTPAEVGRAVADTLTGPLSNKGSGIASERHALDAMAAFRQAIADLVGAEPQGVVHGRSATSLAYDFAAHLSRDWGPADEVVLTRLDHDSNIRPWLQAARRSGSMVRWIDLDPDTGELDLESARQAIGERTVLVAVTGASNLLGTVPPVRAVADLAHAHGALVWVDAVHLVAHVLVDRAALGADVVVCSPYKFLGPHCAALAADPALLAAIVPDRLVPQTDAVPDRFERGTLPYELLAGVSAAVDFLAGIAPGRETGRRERLARSYAAIAAHEHALLDRLESGLQGFDDRVVSWSKARERTPTVCVTLPGRDVRDVYRRLAADHRVLAPAGDFYAWEAVGRLGLPDRVGLRMGIAPYTDERDVDRLLTGLADILRS